MALANFSKYRPFLIVLASSLFVTVIVLAGLLIFYPRDEVQVAEVAEAVELDTQPNDDLLSTEAVSALIAEQCECPDDCQCPPETTAARRDDALDASGATTSSRAERNQGMEEANQQRDSSVASASTTSVIVHSQNGSTKQEVSRPASTKVNTKANTKAVASARANEPSSLLPHTFYWVQLFSSNRHEQAETVQSKLERYSLEGIIVQHNIDGVPYYRLRVGPYYNRDEADKFLTWLRRDPIFNAGYVVQANRNGR